MKALLLALCVSVSLSAQTATANFSAVQQPIDGFGISGAQQTAGPMTTTYADQLFTLNNEKSIGLTFFRIAIYSDGAAAQGYFADQYALSDPQAAYQRGAKIIMGPWSAPPAYKDNASWTGGNLMSAHYQDWANVQTGYINDLKNLMGVPVYAVEVQNEPDFGGQDGTMLMTTSVMTTYVGSYLGPALAAISPKPRLIFPSTATWSSAWAYSTALLADGTAAPYVDIISAHQYNGVDAPGVSNHRIWQTEMSGLAPETFDATMTSGIEVAKWIHDALTTGQANAWLWWWNNGDSTDNEGLRGQLGDGTTGTETKRYYTLGNFSRFIRPGAYRVTVTNSSIPAGMSVSAYRSPRADAIVMVVINNSGGSVSFTGTPQGMVPANVVPYVTSATENLVAHSPITLSGGSWTMTIPDQTVTTFVGAITAPTRIRKIRYR